MKFSIAADQITQVQFLDGEGRVLWSIQNGPPAIDTFTLDGAPESNARVTEGVRRTVAEYGETLRKLSNE